MRVDPYIFALVGAVLLAFLLPATAGAATALRTACVVAVAALFFLYGARLSTAQVLLALRRYPPQLLVLFTTYGVFPALGVLTIWLLGASVSETLKTGVLFLTLLPSTVQSSIAFTSIAGGNVATALCSASISNLAGVFLTPLLTSLLIGKSGNAPLRDGAVSDIALQILAPFVLGQLLRPLLAATVEKHKRGLALFDRGSILLLVYSAFSAGMVQGVWGELRWLELLVLLLVSGALLASILAFTFLTSRAFGFEPGERIAILFCGSKKSLASGIPMANVLFPASAVSAVVVPLLIFHQLQLFVCALLAQKYAAALPAAQAREPAER